MIREIIILIVLLVLSMAAGWFSPIAPWFDVGGFVQSHTILGLSIIALGVYMYHSRKGLLK
jgi:hypothetical protein